MTTFAWDVPGYVQGHRFSNDLRYWDHISNRFRDLAGYDHLGNYVQQVAGVNAFSPQGVNNRVGLLLDNTSTYKFHTAVPWEGSMLFVFQGNEGSSGSATFYPWLWGCSASEISNGHIGMLLSAFAGTTTFSANTPSKLIVSSFTSLPLGAITICAFSFNQAERLARQTRDGVTIIEGPPEAGVNGNPVAIGSVSGPGVIADIGGISHDYVRMGDLVGDGALVPNALGYSLHVFEQHFWKGDVLKDNAEDLADFISSLRDYYGI
jgi:hypothetical protein